MKKYKFLLAITILAGLILVASPIARAATQDITLDDSTSSDTSDLDTTADDTSVDTTAAVENAGTPDTGIAPTHNKVLASTLMFVGGAAIGGTVGLVYIKTRKKHTI